MIDLHHHCLPGVDDGPRTLEEAVAQCEAAFEDGIRTVVATPHRLHPQFDCPPEAARRAHADLAAALAARRIGIELLLGAEVHCSEGLAAGLGDGSLLPLAGSRRWFLLELPHSHVPVNLDRVVFSLQIAGWYPLLAHPERNTELVERDGALAALRRQGVRTQLTAMSVTGGFGRAAREASERWLREGLVDVLATDAHGTGRRPPRLSEAVERAAAIVGREAADRLVGENPRRILAGMDPA